MTNTRTTAVHSRTDFVRVPLSERRSKKDEKSLVKIVHADEGEFLSEWSFEDIGREPYGVVSKRPMVYMTDAHEAVEKSMWCYERGMVPLIGEPDPDVAAYSAKKYKIDQLIVDPESCAKLLSYLSSRSEPLLAISVVGSAFDASSLMPLARYAAQVRLVLALPETGVLAEAVLAEEPLFYVEKGCRATGEPLVVTKQTPLVTPIADYITGIHVHARSHRADGSVESFVLAA